MPPTPSKRLYTQSTSESVTEPIQVNTVVIIHPGSLNLRIGRASDTFPVTIPHCIARKKKDASSTDYKSSWMIRSESMHGEMKQQQKLALKLAEDTMASKPMSSGEYRQPIPPRQYHAFNGAVKCVNTDVICSKKWTNTDNQSPYIIGDEALYCLPRSGYILNWPVRRGHLNLHDGPGGSMSAVLADLEVIWGQAIEQFLDIPLKDLKIYRAILLIPDVYEHKHVKELMSLLLDRLGFGSAIVHQESVCAAFGTGVSSACIVDIGDQKTSICCVEDGISLKNTRITMEYGGCDISRCLHTLMGRAGFIPKDIDLSNTVDCLLLQEIKETCCHLDQDSYGVIEQTIQIKKPEQKIVKYSLKFGDEFHLAAFSVFFPDIYGLQGTHLVHVQKRFSGDPEDPHDEFYLRQTQSQQQSSKPSKKKETSTADISTRDETSLSMFEDSQLISAQMDEDSIDGQDGLTTTDNVKIPRRTELDEEQEQEAEEVTQLMGIDQAILHSVDKCAGDELKKKMYSCIVVVGGGMNFEGAQQWLQYRVWVGMPAQYRLMLETMDVITRPKETDPQLTSWKGATILACLDTTHELWIKKKEWDQFNVRMLRERAPFVW
ncbi:hypothetical protein ACJMK2_015515 [Sinanodonta woodiana]|uniref:Actin-related protein 8 n=1 Tax=Sinanodonta woodiana TaxID=1069815 RepID=A0ABD3UQW1_SINWO